MSEDLVLKVDAVSTWGPKSFQYGYFKIRNVVERRDDKPNQWIYKKDFMPIYYKAGMAVWSWSSHGFHPDRYWKADRKGWISRDAKDHFHSFCLYDASTRDLVAYFREIYFDMVSFTVGGRNGSVKGTLKIDPAFGKGKTEPVELQCSVWGD